MKTKTYLTTVLAFTLQMIVNGQTQDRQVNSDLKKTEQSSDKKILNSLKAQPIETITPNAQSASITRPTILDQNQQYDDITSATTEHILYLQKYGEELSLEAQKIRNNAKSKSGIEKCNLMSHALDLDKQAMLKQIEALELSGKMSLLKFNENKKLIKSLVSSIKEDNIPYHSKYLISSSEKNMRLAKEMRQEAYAFTNIASKLGTMGNAEEKELLALNEQTQVLDEIGKNNKITMR